MTIIEELIEQVDKLSGYKGRTIMGYGYPLFEWATGIEINKTMENYEEENIMADEEIPIQHNKKSVNM